MTPLYLKITNFRSFAETTVFEFPRGPGLYFMRGENRAEPSLEANGAGKSTLFEALCWCLYGKTSRGLKAGDVSNWGVGKGTEVEFGFLIDGAYEASVLRRTWKPNTLTLDGDDIAKLNVEDAVAKLGLGFAPFLHSVFLAQSQPMFLDLKAEAKAAMFSEVLGLDRWLECSARASERAKAQDSTTRRLERELAEIEGELRGLDVDTSDDGAAAWEAQRSKELAELEDEYARLVKLSKDLKAELADAQDDERGCRDKLADQIAAVVTCVEAAKRYRDDILQPAHDACLQHATRIEDARERLDILERGECPTCGHDATDVEIDRATAALNTLIEDGQPLVDKRTVVREKYETLQRAADIESDKESRARKAVDRAIDTTSKIRNDLQRNERALDTLEERADEIAKKSNPFHAQQERLARRRAALAVQRKSTSAAVDASQSKAALYQFWVRGFKELRLQLIGDALAALEVESNSCLAKLGLADWSLEFSVDRETKGGSVSRGFTARVLSPSASTEKSVPWEAWSGGEAQRLRVAAQMGLADLIRDHSGTALGLEIWDEPTQGLSAQGVQDLLDALHRRAVESGRQIWLVDHRSLAYGGFAGVVTVVKDGSGSRIVYGDSQEPITYENRRQALPNIERTRRRYTS